MKSIGREDYLILKDSEVVCYSREFYEGMKRYKKNIEIPDQDVYYLDENRDPFFINKETIEHKKRRWENLDKYI